MKRLVLAAAAMLSGCAIQPTLISTSPSSGINLPFSKIEIDDFATPKQVKDTDVVYFSGWFPIGDKWVNPPLHEAITSKMRGSLKASGQGSAIQLAVIDAGLFMDSKKSDFIAFVGLAAAFRERPYKCNLVVNIRTPKKSERKVFEHTQIANRSFAELENKSEFVGRCQDELVQKLANYLESVK
jgi:hypothetical protein